MKIAQIMLASGMGGAEGYFVALSKALAARGHEVVVICERRFERRDELEACFGVTVFPVTVLGRWDRLAGWRIKKILQSCRPQLVHLHLARAAHLGGCAAKALSIPT
ncbi:MAG TPA: glycosyltransferase, partial [Halothiobacillaceae bacterium]|nr:glycosyltransferase [Halothiobacillaceae bacterium]